MSQPVSPAYRSEPGSARGSALAVVLVAMIALLVSCGDSESTGTAEFESSANGVPDPAPGSDLTAPCLPPDCATTLPAEVREGYLGPQREVVAGAAAAVDGASVVTAASGAWWARGLVVNGAAPLGGTPTVRATLRDASGAVLERVEAPVLVVPLRTGEPSPFRVAAPDVEAASVADVGWEVVGATAVADGSIGRTSELAVAWSRPAGGEPLDVPGYADGGGPQSPLVTYVTVRNVGAVPITSPTVVAAWVDGRGAVLGLAEANVLEPGTSEALGALQPGASADAVLVLASSDAASVGGSAPLLWGVGR